jgi:hypothetical protein
MARVGIWLAVALVVLGAAGIRLRLLDVPLDRDEGEYAYFGQLLLQGVPPYAAAYNLKAPGIYVAYALILAVFGQTTTGIHLGLIVVTSATTILMFLLARHLAGPVAGLVAAAVFAVQALNPKLLAVAAYAEHFVLLFAIAGFVVLQSRGSDRGPMVVLAAGFLFGLAFLMKQSGTAFIIGGAVYVLLSSHTDGHTASWSPRVRTTALFLAGVLAPFALACLALLLAGTLKTFVFWAFVYGATYSAALSAGVANLVGQFVYAAPSSSVMLALAAIGFVVVLRDRHTPRRLFVLLLTAAACVGTAVGLHFRPQYFLLMLPALAMLTAIGLQALVSLVAVRPVRLRRVVVVVVVAAAVGQPLYASRAPLFELGPGAVSRLIYGANPFPESVQVGRYIREHTAPGDRIAVIGSEPQIYFYAGRRSATGYIYTYPLMELQPYATAMQQQMIREIENAAPRYLVFVRASSSWLVRDNSDRTIFGWFAQYQRSFKRVGVVDIGSRRETIYRWDGDALGYAPRSDTWMMVFERGDKP